MGAGAGAAGGEGGGLCGLPTAGGTLRVGAGVEVLRPLDVRVSLGGPLPLLPLIDVLARCDASAAPRAAQLVPMVLHSLTLTLTLTRTRT